MSKVSIMLDLIWRGGKVASSATQKVFGRMLSTAKHHDWKWSDLSLLSLPVEGALLVDKIWPDTLSVAERSSLQKIDNVLSLYFGRSTKKIISTGIVSASPGLAGLIKGPKVKGLAAMIDEQGSSFLPGHFYKIFDRSRGIIHVLGRHGVELFRFDKQKGFLFPSNLNSRAQMLLKRLVVTSGNGEIFDVLDGAEPNSVFYGWLAYLDIVASVIFPKRRVMNVVDKDDFSIITDPSFVLKRLINSGVSYDRAYDMLKLQVRYYLDDVNGDPFLSIVDSVSEGNALPPTITDKGWTERFLDSKADDNYSFVESVLRTIGFQAHYAETSEDRKEESHNQSDKSEGSAKINTGHKEPLSTGNTENSNDSSFNVSAEDFD